MISREWKSVTVISFQSGTDSYGQKRTVESSRRTVQMVCKIYSQSNVNSPIYNEVEMIGITKDFTISDVNQIIIDSVTYNILYTIPSGKYLQILMKRAM